MWKGQNTLLSMLPQALWYWRRPFDHLDHNLWLWVKSLGTPKRVQLHIITMSTQNKSLFSDELGATSWILTILYGLNPVERALLASQVCNPAVIFSKQIYRWHPLAVDRRTGHDRFWVRCIPSQFWVAQNVLVLSQKEQAWRNRWWFHWHPSFIHSLWIAQFGSTWEVLRTPQ